LQQKTRVRSSIAGCISFLQNPELELNNPTVIDEHGGGAAEIQNNKKDALVFATRNPMTIDLVRHLIFFKNT